MNKKKPTASGLNTGQLLHNYVKENRINQTLWARQQGVSYKIVNRYLKTRDMRVNTLVNISKTLGHNFVLDIAHTLPSGLAHTPNQTDTSLPASKRKLKRSKKKWRY